VPVQVRAVVQTAVTYARDGYTFDPLKEKKQKEALERRKAEEVRRALLFIPRIDVLRLSSHHHCIVLMRRPTAHSYR